MSPDTTPNPARARLEHVNITVADPHRTATLLSRLFGWEVRWEGPGKLGGYSVHVGNDADYLSLWRPAPGAEQGAPGSQLNHIGILVDDLAQAEERVRAAGFITHNHADYEPGRRFYFDDDNGIEFEVVSYR